MSDRFSIQNTTLAGDKQPVLRITYCLSNQNTVSSSMSVSPIMARKSLRNCFQKNRGPRLPRTRTLGTLQSLFVQSSLLVPPICGPKSKNGDLIFCPPTTIQASCLHHRRILTGSLWLWPANLLRQLSFNLWIVNGTNYYYPLIVP